MEKDTQDPRSHIFFERGRFDRDQCSIWRRHCVWWTWGTWWGQSSTGGNPSETGIMRRNAGTQMVLSVRAWFLNRLFKTWFWCQNQSSLILFDLSDFEGCRDASCLSYSQPHYLHVRSLQREYHARCRCSSHRTWCTVLRRTGSNFGVLWIFRKKGPVWLES